MSDDENKKDLEEQSEEQIEKTDSQEETSSDAATELKESFGEWMREQRNSHQASLEDIASVTKIQLSMLKKIEENDYTDLPAPAFIRGFVVSFARHLGIDETEAVERFRRQLKEVGLDKDLYSQSVEKQEEVAKHAQKLSETKAPAYHASNKAIDINKTPVVTIKRAVIAISTVLVILLFSYLFQLGVSKEENAEVVSEESVEEIIITEENVDEMVTEDEPSQPEAQPEPAPEPKPEPEPTPKDENKVFQYHLKLRGLDSSWVNVRSDNGDSKGSILEKGQIKDFFANKKINVALSDAGSVEIYWNGKWYQPAGFRGDVKSVSLPESLETLKIKPRPKPKPVVEAQEPQESSDSSDESED